MTTSALAAPITTGEELFALARAIRDQLNIGMSEDVRHGWAVEGKPQRFHNVATLDGPHPDDPDVRVRVSMRVEEWRKDGGRKITLSGNYEHTGSQPWRGGPSGEQRTDTIHASVSRGPRAIAGDIRRRLLPGVEGITQDMTKQTAAREAATQQRLETIDRLARAGRDVFTLTVPHGGDPAEQSRRWIIDLAKSAPRSWVATGELDVSGGKLSFDGLSIAQMETLLTAYALVAHD